MSAKCRSRHKTCARSPRRRGRAAVAGTIRCSAPAARRLMTRSKQAWSSFRSSHHSRVLTDVHHANAQTFHGFCRSEVRMSASRSTAGSVIRDPAAGIRPAVVMRAALVVDCNQPSAVGTARNWLPADASKPAARTAVKIGAASRTQTGKTQNECSAAASPGHSATDASRSASRRPSRARRSSRSVRNVLSLRANRRSIAVGERCRSCAISSSPGKLRTAPFDHSVGITSQQFQNRHKHTTGDASRQKLQHRIPCNSRHERAAVG